MHFEAPRFAEKLGLVCTRHHDKDAIPWNLAIITHNRQQELPSLRNAFLHPRPTFPRLQFQLQQTQVLGREDVLPQSVSSNRDA